MNLNHDHFDFREGSIVLLRRYLVEMVALRVSAPRATGMQATNACLAERHLETELAHLTEVTAAGIMRLGGTLIDALASGGRRSSASHAKLSRKEVPTVADLLSTLIASLTVAIQTAAEREDHDGVVVFARVFQAVQRCLNAAAHLWEAEASLESNPWPLAEVA